MNMVLQDNFLMTLNNSVDNDDDDVHVTVVTSNYINSNVSQIFTSITATTTAFSVVKVLSCLIGIAGTVSNLLSCVVIAVHKPLRQRCSDYFIINQCLLDFFVGLALVLIVAVPYARNPAYCYLLQTYLLFACPFTVSVWNIAALAFERYVEIVHPIKHRLMLTRRTAICSICCLWLLGLVYTTAIVVTPTRVIDGDCCLGVFPSVRHRQIWSLSNAVGLFLLPLSVITACYISMARSVRRLRHRATDRYSTYSLTQETTMTILPSSRDNGLSRASRNIVKVVAVISVMFVLTVGPAEIFVLYYGVGLQPVDFNATPFVCCLMLMYANCCVNPFIYLFRHDEFRRGVGNLMRMKTVARAQLDAETQIVRTNVFSIRT